MRSLTTAIATALSLVVGILSSSSGAAQLPAGSFFLQEPTNLTRVNRIFRMEAYGRRTSVAATMPAGWVAIDATMDERNRGLMICGLGANSAALFRASPGTAPRLFVGPGRFQRPTGIVLDEAGDWLVVDENARTASLDFYRVTSSGVVSSITQLGRTSFVRMAYDPEAGQALLLGLSGARYEFVRVDAKTGAVTTFTQTQLPFQPATITDPTYEPETGGFVFAGVRSASRFPRVFRVTAEGGARVVSTIAIAAKPIAMARYRDRRAPDVHALLVADGAPSIKLLVLSRQGRLNATHAVLGTVVAGRDFMVRAGGRSLTRRNPARGVYTLDVSFPFEAGKTCAIGLSLRGSQPGAKLVDRRVIPLNVDVITLIGLGNLWPTVFSNLVSSLDAQGRSTANIDLRAFATAIRGLRLTAVALALDPAAAAGVAEISPPLNIRL